MKKLVNMKRFLKLMFRGNKFTIFIAFILMAIVSMIDLSIPQLTREILDHAIKLKDTNFLIKIVTIYMSISILSSVLNVVLSYIHSIIKKKTSVKLKIKLLKHISKLSGNYYVNIKTGNLINTIENDLFIIEDFGIEMLFSLIIDFFTAIIALVFLVKMQIDLLVVVILVQIGITYSQSKFTNIIAFKTSQIRENAGNIANSIQEYISNITNIVISKSVFRFFKKYLNQEKILLNKCIQLDMIMELNVGIAKILSSFIMVFTYGYGGLKIINGDMTIGELIAFQQYIAMLIGPCLRIIKSSTKIHQSEVSMNRIFNIIDEPIEIKQNNKGIRFTNKHNGDIVFDKVKFRYEEGCEPTVCNMNLNFESGKTTALVGPSGCGKSTIINLLFRLWDINEGDIKIDNISIKEYNLKSIRNQISIVTQNVLLFDDSIMNNINVDNININKEYMEAICKKLGINEITRNLPNGFNTIIGENGVKLSGGQKQRISIARALISNSKIIVFDEATSGLDNISQENLLNNIKEFIYDKTVIVIAHRLSTIKYADKIYVIDKGQVIEEGNHEELIHNKGLYYKLQKNNI